MNNAFFATLTHTLGLSSRELAEVGGFSDRFARDLLAGRRPFPVDVQEAIQEIEEDIDVLTDSLVADVEEGEAVIWMFGTNEELRAAFPQMPGRGQSTGGFIGPFRIAALTAREILNEQGIEVDILFYGDERKQNDVANL
ncbi:hypothetical protein [Marinomonas sp.]|uniref:hypothetical protein n=1 Tax=Marinomonas sp. TaxID=1904862 RepID=UPI003A9043BD